MHYYGINYSRYITEFNDRDLNNPNVFKFNDYYSKIYNFLKLVIVANIPKYYYYSNGSNNNPYA
jgi:hypothetical protein